jgi:hypothetical protein
VLHAEAAAVAGDDLFVRRAIVEAVAVVPDVPEAIPLAGGLRPKAVEVVVAAVTALAGDRVPGSAAAVEGRIGTVDAEIEGEDRSLPYERCPGEHPFGGEEVQAAELVIVAEEAPGGLRRGAGLNG